MQTLRENKKITFEYIVWKGINDSIDDVNALISYCKSIPSKVNLIEYNSIATNVHDIAIGCKTAE